MKQQPSNIGDFERFPVGQPTDETDISLRAYVSQLPASRLSEYRTDWTDDRVKEWDGNFRSDGCLMLVCCERDVDVAEFRRVLEQFLSWRSSQQGQ